MVKIDERTIISVHLIQMKLLAKLSEKYTNKDFDINLKNELDTILTEFKMQNQDFEQKKRLLFNTSSIFGSLVFFAVWQKESGASFPNKTLGEFGIIDNSPQTLEDFTGRLRNSLSHNRITLFDDESIHIEDGYSKNSLYTKTYEVTISHQQLINITVALIDNWCVQKL